jgi:hypothetical protein
VVLVEGVTVELELVEGVLEEDAVISGIETGGRSGIVTT